jgi:adenine-specific DNA-methyltransferase
MNKIEANDPAAQSADILADNLSQLKSLFPEAFAEGKVQFDTLRQLLGGTVDEADEKYGLNWHGKRRARQIALTPSTGTLRPYPNLDESVDWATTQNLMIEGDNLEVLKLLQKSYSGKVKLIYIDPPYNTGKDFVYPDDFRDGIRNFLELTGQMKGGARLAANVDASGRFHTDWLNMMYPRVRLARSLLSNDGMIYLSVDDNEVHNLRKICDEVFGEENFIGQFIINSSPSAIDYGHIAKMNDYALLYAKDLAETTSNQLTEEDKEFKYSDATGQFNIYPLYNGNVAFNPKTRPNLYYPFYLNPNSKIGSEFYEIGLDKQDGWAQVFPVISRKDGIQRVWRWGRDKSRGELNREIVGYKTDEGEYRVVQKSRHTGKVIRSLQIDKDISTRRGTAEVEELFGQKVFPFPKPIELIRRFIAVATDSDSIVVDFFAGSGTTGHATLLQNSLDGGTRRFILVQLPEVLDINDDQQRIAAEYCEKLGKPKTIAELTKERLRRAGKKIRQENSLFAGDTGFRVFKLDESNLRTWNPNRENLAETLLAHNEHVLSGRSDDDIVYELLLKFGLDLCIPLESRTVAGKTVGAVGGGVLMLCLAEKISANEVEMVAAGMVAWHKVLAPAGDSTVVFRDSAFADDVAKTNMAAILAQNGLENVRSL